MYCIVGASGFLGSYFIKNILEKTDEDIIAVARKKQSSSSSRVQWVSCDVTSRDDVRELNRKYLNTGEPHKIIYLAAYHHPDLVEKNPEIAWDVNVTSLSHFLNAVKNVACFIYPSSDSVYGESINMRVYSEQDDLHPVNRYGVQKSVAERLVTGYGYHVLRYPFLIGPSLSTQKKHFYDVIVERITSGQTMDMFADSYRSALSFDYASGIAVDLIERHMESLPPILNVCGDDALSKYDIGLMIADKSNVPRELIRAISIKGSSGIFEAKRAASTLMSNQLLKSIIGVSEIKLTF